MPDTKVSVFANPADLQAYQTAYQAALSRGESEAQAQQEGLLAGDNGVGSSELGGLDTTRYMGVALPRKTLVAQYGENPDAFRQARLTVTAPDGTVYHHVPVIDYGPGNKPQAKGVGMDASYHLANAMGNSGLMPVSYEFESDPGADPLKDPSGWQKEQQTLASNYGEKIPAVPEGAIHKRIATPAEAQISDAIYKRPGPTAEPEEAEPTTPPPQGAVPAAPVSQEEMDQHRANAAGAPEITELPQAKQTEAAFKEGNARIYNAHSEAIQPEDQRVTMRTNPDTGSTRLTGEYFVPQDPVHQHLLRGYGPEDLDKLPTISQAINRGGPFSFMYNSAAQEGGPEEWEGEAPTAEARQFEQKLSTAEERATGQTEGQLQQVMMLPAQLVANQGSSEKPGSIQLEGFVSQKALNNTRNIIGGANAAKIPVPYMSAEDPNFQRDLMGFLENQAHGYRGNGTGPVLDESGAVHRKFDPSYVPHLLNDDQAKFIHSSLYIRPGKGKKTPGPAPSLRQRAKWISAINQAYAGHDPIESTLLDQLDRALPQVYKRKVVRDKKTGQKVELPGKGKYVPWTEGTLEPTWSAYRLENIQHGMPAIGAPSIRSMVGAHLITRHPVYRQHVAEVRHVPGPAPIAENPEVGAPLGPEQISSDPEIGSYTDVPGERIKAAAIRWGDPKRVQRTYTGYNHPAAWEKSINVGRENPDLSDYEEGFVTSHGRFLNRDEARRVAFRASQMARSPLFQSGLVSEDLNYRGRTFEPPVKPTAEQLPLPISENPEVGGPAGAPNPPGTGGLLGEQETESEPEQPSLFGGYEAYSPNLRDDMSFRAAKLALNKPAHQEARNFGNDLEQAIASRYGHAPVENRDAVGDWKDTAENSMMSELPQGQLMHPEVRKLALALKGLHGGQKQVMSFRADPEGEHNFYRLRFNTDDPEKIRDLLDKQKLFYRTLELPKKKGKGEGVTAHIADLDPRNLSYQRLEKLFKQGHIAEAHHWAGTAEFLGDPQGEDRERARDEYERILDQAQEAWRQGTPGGEGAFDRNPDEPASAEPWWAPFRDRAREKYRELRASDLWEQQQLALDYLRSEADRNQIPLKQARTLARYANTAKAWTGANPELHPNAMYSYLLDRSKFPSDKLTKRDIGEWFDANHQKFDLTKPEDQEAVADMYFRDVMHSLAGSFRGKPSEAYGWYDRSVNKTIDHVAQIAPEIKTDPAHNLAFRIALAVTSQGQKVPNNLESTWHVYKYWEKKGEFPTDNQYVAAGGKEIAQILNNLRKMNDMWDTHKAKKLDEILTTPISVGKLNKDYGMKVSGEKVGHTVRGAMGLGPKIGAFFSNLSGHFDPVTMDRWFARQMNMYTGNMFNFSEGATKEGTSDYDAQLKDLSKLLDTPGAVTAAGPDQVQEMRHEIGRLEDVPKGELTRARALETAPRIYDWAKTAERNYMRSYQGEEKVGSKARSYHPDFETPENLLAKRIHENANELSDAPRNSAERDAWRAIVKRTDEKLKDHGIDLTNADKQAVPWFDIKDVFRKAGSNPLRNVDYLDAAYSLVRRVKNGLLPNLLEGA